MTARGDSLGCSRNPGSNYYAGLMHQSMNRPRCRRRGKGYQRFIGCGSAKPVANYYELLRPCAPHWYSDPRGVSRLRSLPLHRSTGSHVPYESLVELRAAYMPDAARAGFRVPPSWSRR